MATTGSNYQSVFNTALTANDSSAKEELGTIRVEHDATYGKKIYMYVLASGAIAAGTVCAMMGATGYTVGKNYTAGLGGSVGQVRAVGVGIGTITDAYYGWIQVFGYCGTVSKDATINACTTAYTEMVYLSGTIRSGKYKNTTTWITATSYFVPCGITALASKGTACTNCASFLHCMV
jgi:hypothetical protein